MLTVYANEATRHVLGRRGASKAKPAYLIGGNNEGCTAALKLVVEESYKCALDGQVGAW